MSGKKPSSVIMLHHVTDDPKLDGLKPYSISRASFVRLLDILQGDGWETVGFDAPATTNKSVVISFDDCPKHLWDFAIPELQKRGMKAAFYMPTAYLGGNNDWDIVQGKPSVPLMNETDIKKLSDIGMEVGSHSHYHIELGKSPVQEVVENLQTSKKILESIIGKPVVSFAFPFGSLPTATDRLLHDAGYQYALAIYTPQETSYRIRRWIYHDNDDAARIRKKLSWQYRLMRAVKDKLGS